LNLGEVAAHVERDNDRNAHPAGGEKKGADSGIDGKLTFTDDPS
jgi:hypothetical protein